MCKHKFMDTECFKKYDCEMKGMCRIISEIDKDYVKAKRKETENGEKERNKLALVG